MSRAGWDGTAGANCFGVRNWKTRVQMPSQRGSSGGAHPDLTGKWKPSWVLVAVGMWR